MLPPCIPIFERLLFSFIDITGDAELLNHLIYDATVTKPLVNEWQDLFEKSKDKQR